MLIVLFLVSHFNFLFVLCGGLSWLPVSFSLHVKYTLSYRIVPINRHVQMLRISYKLRKQVALRGKLTGTILNFEGFGGCKHTFLQR